MITFCVSNTTGAIDPTCWLAEIASLATSGDHAVKVVIWMSKGSFSFQPRC